VAKGRADPEASEVTTVSAKSMLVAMLVAATLLAPATAIASTTHVETRVVSRTDGVEIAQDLIGKLRGIELGASAATVTVDVGAGSRQVRVGLGDTQSTGGGGQGRGTNLLTLAAIPFVAGTVLRLLQFLARLGAA
jgi:opacity protein-like surface antigen